MEGFLVVLAIGVALFLILSRMRAGHAQPSPAVPIQDPAARFQALGAALSSAGDASSHPRDLGSNPVFHEAVDLLESPGVPLSLVLDYAMGANWMPATVACAALSGRSDRDAASAQIARHFRHLSPWPMYYALQYFTKVSERPAVGSLVLHGSGVLDAAPPGSRAAGRAFPGSRRSSGHAWLCRLAVRRDAGSPDGSRNAAPQDRPSNRKGADQWSSRRGARGRSIASSCRRSAASSNATPNTSCSSSTTAIKEHLASAEAFASERAVRSLLVVGEPRAGKTSFLMLLAARAAAQRLDGVRGRRGQSDGRPEVLRTARGAAAPADDGARGREACALVRAGFPAAGYRRHAHGHRPRASSIRCCRPSPRAGSCCISETTAAALTRSCSGGQRCAARSNSCGCVR